jgi:phenylpropionate dioxygenase-like ring-hydroxylating dioxygenase large terminal subunit
MIHNAADITTLHALGFKVVVWRHSSIAWVDVIPHRGESLAMGIKGQFRSDSLNAKLNRVLA